MLLEELLKPQKLLGTKHDQIIQNLSSSNEISPNVYTLFMSAYYKIGPYEGDIDLLQLMYDHKKYELFEYTDVPVKESKLLLFEVKSCYSARNYSKAIKQLVKSKHVLKDNTDYQDIDTFFCYGLNNSDSIVWRYEQI